MDDAIENLVASGVTVAVAGGQRQLRRLLLLARPRAHRGRQQLVRPAGLVFSNYRSCVDLYAPGEGMTSAWLGGGSSTLDGTSMASPHMAGAAALYLGANPEAWPATVNSAILPNASQYKLYNLGAGSPNLLLFTGSGGGGTNPNPVSAYISGPRLSLRRNVDVAGPRQRRQRHVQLPVAVLVRREHVEQRGDEQRHLPPHRGDEGRIVLPARDRPVQRDQLHDAGVLCIQGARIFGVRQSHHLPLRSRRPAAEPAA